METFTVPFNLVAIVEASRCVPPVGFLSRIPAVSNLSYFLLVDYENELNVTFDFMGCNSDNGNLWDSNLISRRNLV